MDVALLNDNQIPSGGSEIEIDEEPNWRENVRSNRARRRDRVLKDQQSTGRKRAARLYPLNPNANCEWQNLKYAGGSKYPIIGCVNGKQQARHHGPDKNTLNNEKGNVWRICHNCHNRWHAANDLEYEWGAAQRPHDAITRATLDEILDNELHYQGVRLSKVVD